MSEYRLIADIFRKMEEPKNRAYLKVTGEDIEIRLKDNTIVGRINNDDEGDGYDRADYYINRMLTSGIIEPYEAQRMRRTLWGDPSEEEREHERAKRVSRLARALESKQIVKLWLELILPNIL